jgi:SSS family solute:Na+ symporter
MAVAAGVKALPEFADGFKAFGNNFAVPALFLHSFPAWFVGIAFAAIAIGALVPAAIMSIACANLFTRNIYKEFFNPAASTKRECDVAKIVSLVVKLGALFFIIELPTQYAINLQLLGGILIIQTLPSVLLGLYLSRLNATALLAGWAVGIVSGSWMFLDSGLKTTYALKLFGLVVPCYDALSSLFLNLAVALVLSVALGGSGKIATEEEFA